MNQFRPPHGPIASDHPPSLPYGLSPGGRWIMCIQDLPQLPIPQRIIVTQKWIEIDGWIFEYDWIKRIIWLLWFEETLVRWKNCDPTPENRNWISGVLEAFKDGITGN